MGIESLHHTLHDTCVARADYDLGQVVCPTGAAPGIDESRL